jgi:hypothetical protein
MVTASRSPCSKPFVLSFGLSHRLDSTNTSDTSMNIGVCESCMTSACAKKTRPAFGTPGASWSRHSCYDFVGVVSNFVSTR